MPLSAGTRLGPYEIRGPLGAGGMGEVYSARDPRLNRDVAIKILPDLFAGDPDRLARFMREAQTLASLNHPNIAQIYGVEEVPSATSGQAGSRALVMELVDGEDLSAAIARGPIPTDDALALAKQIIEALEAAHDLGIVHRDLKPANIKVRSDGAVKVLDFGLAKATEAAAAASTVNSPTLSVHATQMGIILGTAAYMSPEQARGRPVDKRTDVWAFGCVLYEMLTGRKAFDGEDATEIISSVVKSEPDWTAFSAAVPEHVRDVVRRCLVKDRKARIPDLSVVRYLLDDAPRERPPESVRRPQSASRRIFSITAVALLALAALTAGAGWYRAATVSRPVARFQLAPPAGTTFMTAAGRVASAGAISPDGQTVAFTAQGTSGKRQLWLRPLDSLTARVLSGTDDAAYPFWSPDSRFIGYAAPGRLMKVAAAGGTPELLCELIGPTITGRGGAWNRDDVIVFNNGPTVPLQRVSSAGGVAQPLPASVSGITGWQFPSFLPDGRHLLVYAASGTAALAGVYVQSIDGGEPKRLIAADTGAIYDARAGRLLYVRQNTLFARPFDAKALTFAGEAAAIAEGVEADAIPGLVAFSVSESGTLVYGSSAADGNSQLTWVARDGHAEGTVGPPGRYRGIELSPDGSRIAAHRHDAGGGDIWVTEIARDATSRLTFNAAEDNASPVWSADGTRIAYGSNRSAKWGVYARPANGGGDEVPLFEASPNGTLGPQPSSWAPDGSLVMTRSNELASRELWLIPAAAGGNPMPLNPARFPEQFAQVSPDGKWLAYMSIESGDREVYVRRFPAGGDKWPISSGGGSRPRWRGDGRELFYINGPQVMAVDVTVAGSTFQAGKPRALFAHGSNSPGHPTAYFDYAVARDGQRFLITRPRDGEVGGTQAIAVVLNWIEGLKR